jgi:D-glycero-D-manno-heptose 1,7-bisphosphate phosphatase
MKKAVFLDRDGVINKLVLNPATGEFEPPHCPDDLELFPYVIECLQILMKKDFLLFLISNQPDFAKGKTSLENLNAVHEKLDDILKSSEIRFLEYYYCYHHPNGIVPEYSMVCECRKPKPHFLKKAARDHRIDLKKSWMIGDRDSDIECGKSAGVFTILINEMHSSGFRGCSNPDFETANLKEAVTIILDN